MTATAVTPRSRRNDADLTSMSMPVRSRSVVWVELSNSGLSAGDCSMLAAMYEWTMAACADVGGDAEHQAALTGR